MRPVLEAAPLKLKPMTEKIAITSRSLPMIFSACVAILPVYSSEAPAGACTRAMKYPGSSSGTNDCGTVRSTHQVSPSVPMKTTTTAQRQAMPRRNARTYPLVPAETPRSKKVKNRPLEWLSRSSSSAESAGVKVTALNAESATANAIVMENCA